MELRLQGEIMTFLAGAAAERHHRGRRHTLGAGHDFAVVADLVSRLAPTPDEERALLRWLELRTTRLVSAHWPWIVARALLARGTLTGAQLVAVIREAERARVAAAAPRSARDAAKMPRRRHDKPTGNARGRPRKAGSQRDVAARTGESPREQERLERHVALVDRWSWASRSPPPTSSPMPAPSRRRSTASRSARACSSASPLLSGRGASSSSCCRHESRDDVSHASRRRARVPVLRASPAGPCLERRESRRRPRERATRRAPAPPLGGPGRT